MTTFVHKHYKFIFFLGTLIIASLWVSRISPAPPQTNIIDLADAFLHGRLDLIQPVRVWNDYAVFHHKFFIHYGPLPGVLFMPFVILFGLNFSQQVIIPFIFLITFVGIYKICRNIGAISSNALWLATFFVFGTIYLILTLTEITSYNVQIIGLLFLVLAILEFTGKSRPILVGLFLSLAGLTRATIYPAVIFFILESLFKRDLTWRYKLIQIISLVALPTLSLFFLGFYNYARFGNVLDTGYGYIPETFPGLIAAKEYGVFSLKHIPGNLYMFLFKGPEPIHSDKFSFVLQFPYLRASEWGMGIFFTSPVLVYLILTKLKERYVLSSLITAGVLLIIPLTFYGMGIWQYGYRYALDIYPFLILILCSIFKKEIPLFAKCLIVYGIVFNLLFMYSIWHVYPFK